MSLSKIQAVAIISIMLKKYFREYYESWKTPVPDLISSREIGFIPFYGSMIRHLGLRNSGEVDAFVKRNVPLLLLRSDQHRRIMSPRRSHLHTTLTGLTRTI